MAGIRLSLTAVLALSGCGAHVAEAPPPPPQKLSWPGSGNTIPGALTSPIEASTVAALVPPEHALVEGVAVDPLNSRLFVTSVVGRELAYREAAHFHAVDIEGAGSLMGMFVDETRRLLWIASGRVAQTPEPESAYSGLFAINLDTLAVAARIPAPPAMRGALGDVAVGGDGSVYASNGETGEVYRCIPGCDQLASLVPAGLLRSAQGLAVSPDGSHLLVADYAYGLAAVDLLTGSVEPLTPAAGVPLVGVDGLVGDGNRLFAIQNGIKPFRIVEIRISDDGRQILGARILERAHRAWGEPTLGAFAAGALLYVSNAGWEDYKAGGVYSGPEPRPATVIRRIAVDPA